MAMEIESMRLRRRTAYVVLPLRLSAGFTAGSFAELLSCMPAMRRKKDIASDE